MKPKLRVGVVGGGVGRAHIAAFQAWPDDFDVQVICELDEARAARVAEEFAIPRVATDLAELCRMDELDVIDLCTPSHLHYPQTLTVLAAGKHVICEKPVAGSLRQADELIVAEAQSGRRVMPIFQYRFGRGLQKLKWLRDHGVTGRALLTTAETAWRRRPEYYAVAWRGRWPTELGGALVTLAIHAHDAVCYLLGPARSVAAHLATLVNPIETEDTAAVSLAMADGSLASFSVTTGSAVEISRHRFCFSNLTAESNLRPYANTGDEWVFAGDTPAIDARIAECLAGFELQPEGKAGQFYRYARALEAGGELPVTLADARASLELLTAIYYAARTRQAAELPIGADHPLYAGWQP
jgi:predicted dehydrogenase